MAFLPDISLIALGSVIGTVFWLFALLYYFPRKFKHAEERIENRIKEKETEYMNKIEGMVKGEDSDFNQILDDKLPDMTGKILDSLSNFNDPKVQELVRRYTRGIWFVVQTDEELKKDMREFMQGKINSAVAQIESRFHITEEEMKKLHGLIKKAPNPEDMPEIDPNNPMAFFMSMLGGGRGGIPFM